MDDTALKKSALLIVNLTSFLFVIMGSSVNIALPTIAEDLSMDAILLTWVSTSYLLAAAMFLVPLGRVADIFGRKKIFTIGTIVYTLASLLSGLSTSSYFLIGSRIVQGIGGAMIFGTGLAIITSVFPPGERGKALGLNVSAVYAGLFVGPFVGGFLTEQLGWRSVFFAHVPLGMLVVVAAFWRLKGEWAGARGEKLDILGSVVYSLMLVSGMYGISLLPESIGVIFIVIGALGLVFFIFWEMKTANPVFDVRLFRYNRVFSFSSIAALIHYSATFAVTFLLSLYLQYIKGLTPQTAGLVLVCQPIVMALFSPYAGKLSDRIEPRIVASLGMAMTVLALALLTTLDNETGLVFVIGALMLLGFGFALFSSPNTNAIMSSVEKRLYGVASGAVGTMRLIGQIFSMGITMLIFAIYIGRVEIAPENYPQLLFSSKMIFIIFVILTIGGIFASLARGDIRRNDHNSN